MKKKHKIKEYDIQLQKYVDRKSFIKIYRTIQGNEENLRGFILSFSKLFMFLQTDNEFRLDGFAIFMKDDFDSIRHSSYEKTQRKIFKAEGILDNEYGFEHKLLLDNWSTIIGQLKELDYHIIIESEKKDYLNFHIGQIIKVSNKTVSLLNYDPNGIYDKKPTIIKLEKIRTLKFADNYSTVFRKYLKQKKSN